MKKTFKHFLEHSNSKYGEYPADESEKAMVHRIIDLCLGGKRTPSNYDIAYSFLESDLGGKIWNKYYELFHEKHPDFIGVQNTARKFLFNIDVKSAFKKYKGAKQYAEQLAKRRAKQTPKSVKEDVFAVGDELMAAVNPQTSHRASQPNRINTNRHNLGKQSSLTRGVPVFYAFSYRPNDEPGGSTELLKSFKGKGPFNFPKSKRDKFLDDATLHMAGELKKIGLTPDVIVTPQSSSSLTTEFAISLAQNLDVKSKKINAFKKSSSADILDDDLVRAKILEKHIDIEYFDEKFTASGVTKEKALRDLVTAIIRSIKKHGFIVAKEIDKRMLKFVKNIVESDLTGDDEYSLIDKYVMVVDDVLSSGATMSDLIRISKDLGAKDVFGVTLFARTSAK